MITKREMEVVLGYARGQTRNEIAEALGISEKTVDTHRIHALKKLGLKTNADLTLHAISVGWIPARCACSACTAAAVAHTTPEHVAQGVDHA